MSEYLTEADFEKFRRDAWVKIQAEEAVRTRRLRTAFWRGLKRGVLIGIGWRRG